MRSQVQAGVGARVICLQRGRGMQARPAKVFFELAGSPVVQECVR